MRKLALILTLAFTTIILQAQNSNKCGTTSLLQKELINNADYLTGYNNALQQNAVWLEQNKGVSRKSVITLPVVVHIVYKSSHPLGIGTNIPDFQIEDAFKIINEDFSKTNAEFPNPPRNTFSQYAGNANLKFCLATVDPNGAATNGVTRTATTKNNFSYDTEAQAMKRNSTGGADGWPTSEYINIWVCDIVNTGSGQILGYSTFPGMPSWNAWKDGMVIDWYYFGTVGNASSNDGTTPTHELGHYLGLPHTFCAQEDVQGNPICCDPDDGYGIDDTPATEEVYYGPVNSSTSNNTCDDTQYPNNIFTTDVLDMDENFMSYAESPWMFTNGQIDVMNATLNGDRSALKNSTVTVNCSGIISSSSNINFENISIYPNPNSGKLFFNSTKDIKTIIITNIIGETVFINNHISSNSIDINSLKNGIYFIIINTEDETVTKKIVLSK